MISKGHLGHIKSLSLLLFLVALNCYGATVNVNVNTNGTVNSVSTALPLNFTGLNLDTDLTYRIRIQEANKSLHRFKMTFNNNSGANYGNTAVGTGSGTPNAVQLEGDTFGRIYNINEQSLSNNINITIWKSGYGNSLYTTWSYNGVNYSSHSYSATSTGVFGAYAGGGIYNGSSITSIQIWPDAGTSSISYVFEKPGTFNSTASVSISGATVYIGNQEYVLFLAFLLFLIIFGIIIFYFRTGFKK